jgi:hypothetical protein
MPKEILSEKITDLKNGNVLLTVVHFTIFIHQLKDYIIKKFEICALNEFTEAFSFCPCA